MSTSEPADLFVGLDVGAARVHGVALARRSGRLAVVGVHSGPPTAALVGFCSGARRVAVDSPGGPSAGAHQEDRSVAAKFRAGRCSEIPHPGVPPVPWVTPSDRASAPGWMITGFDVWQQLARAGLDAVETFPAAAFHRMNGGRWPPAKTSRPGRAARVGLLASRIQLPADAAGWTHDLLDAAVAALTAAAGAPLPHDCPRPDGSRLWLPPP